MAVKKKVIPMKLNLTLDNCEDKEDEKFLIGEFKEMILGLAIHGVSSIRVTKITKLKTPNT